MLKQKNYVRLPTPSPLLGQSLRHARRIVKLFSRRPKAQCSFVGVPAGGNKGPQPERTSARVKAIYRIKNSGDWR